MSLTGILSLAGQSLLAMQRSIDVSSGNVSNAFSEGYVRKISVIANSPTGSAYVQNVKRAFDQALFARKLGLLSESEKYSEYIGVLDSIESLFSDLDGAGISDALDEFFDALNDVAVNPLDMSARSSVISKARLMVSKIRESYDMLVSLKKDKVLSLKNSIEKLNSLLGKLSDINRNVKVFGEGSAEAGELLDERDRVLADISKLLNVKTVFHDGVVELYTSKGFPLVLQGSLSKVSVDVDDDGNPVIYVNGKDLTDDIDRGEIGGVLKGISFINDTVSKLNDFVSVFAASINKLHRQGYDINGNAGEDFFGIDGSSGSAVLDASNIVVSISDPALIAASSDSNSQSDNVNIKRMINIKESIVGVFSTNEESALRGNGLTIGSVTYRSDADNYDLIKKNSFYDFYASSIVAPVGLEIDRVKDMHGSSEVLLASVEDKISSFSGVSIDEEIMNIERLQRAYEASAIVISIADELVKTILSTVGG